MCSQVGMNSALLQLMWWWWWCAWIYSTHFTWEHKKLFFFFVHVAHLTAILMRSKNRLLSNNSSSEPFFQVLSSFLKKNKNLLTGIVLFFFYSKQHATWSVHPASHLRALFFCPSVTWQRFPRRGIYCFYALSLRVFTQFPVLSQRLKPTLSGLIAFWKVRVILNSFSVFKYSKSTWSGEVIYYIMNIHVTYYQRG